jgi:hypothetical protein
MDSEKFWMIMLKCGSKKAHHKDGLNVLACG